MTTHSPWKIKEKKDKRRQKFIDAMLNDDHHSAAAPTPAGAQIAKSWIANGKQKRRQ
jgi:hypothetical protein